jgi:uroporphyrinogen decarboxylase
MQTPREIFTRCLRFQNPERIPRDLWLLPWAEMQFPDKVMELKRLYPPDIIDAPNVYRASPRVKGDPYEPGLYVDEWGSVFTNIQRGAIGEVRTPMVRDIAGWRDVKPPYETLPDDYGSARDRVSRFCAETDKFVKAPCCPRPWERFQFLRSTENAMLDVLAPEEGAGELLDVIHSFYMKELEFWVTTDVDAVMFMDDWGAQTQLLISPALWRDLFKPLYKDYCDLAHAHGKFAMMHSDGNITSILGDLIEVGVDAVNSQLFCMDMAELATIGKGKISFWGEIDRQHILPGSPDAGRAAVREVAEHLYLETGGLIAQLELGLRSNPDTAAAVYDEWGRVHEERRRLHHNEDAG